MMFLNQFARTSLPISIAAFLLTLFYSQLLSENLDLLRATINASATLLIYNFSIHKEAFIASPKEFFKSHYYLGIILLTLLSMLVLIYSIRFIGALDYINYIHLLVLSLLYEGPKSFNIRKIPFLKPFIISYIWTLSCIAPYYYDYIIFPSPIFIIECFTFIFGLCLFFDYRDTEKDQYEDIKTFANVLDLKQIKKILFVLWGFSTIFAFIYFCFSYYLILMTLYHLIIIIKLKEDRPNWYYLLLVDGVIILRGLLLFYTA